MRRGCGRARSAAKSRTQRQPPPTRHRRERAAKMKYLGSTTSSQKLLRRPHPSRRALWALLRMWRIDRPHGEERHVATRLETMRPVSLSQPFQQRRNVDLVGFVVAGERVHHDVDAGAEGKFALARFR